MTTHTTTTPGTDEVTLPVLIGQVMGAVLEHRPLEPHEDFFDLGGDSLRAIEVLQQMAEHPDLIDYAGHSEVQAAMLEGIFEDGSPNALEKILLDHAGR